MARARRFTLGKLTRRLGKSALIAVLGLGLGACEDPESNRVEVRQIGLSAFETCDGLLDYFQQEALAEVRFWGWGAPARGDGRDVGAPTAQDGGEGAGEPGAPDFSATNVQEAGVDEPDLVKTDGRHLFVLHGRQLLIYDAADLALQSATDLPGWASGMLMEAGRLAVLSTSYGAEVLPEGVPERFARTGKVRVAIYDVAEPARPRLLRETQVEGDLVAARLVGGTVRAVVHFDGAWAVDWDVDDVMVDRGRPTEPAEPPQAVPGTATRVDPQVPEWEQAWRDAVAQTTIEDWIPFRVDTLEGQAVAGPVTGCGAFQRPGEAAGHGVTAIISVDLDDPSAQMADPAVVTAPGVVYASADSLYLATVNHAGWLVGGGGDVAVGGGVATGVGVVEGDTATPMETRVDSLEAAQRQATQIHKLAIDDPEAPAGYLGSGRVFGVPLNQFSLDEHAGHLRIGTTEQTPADTVNHLFVLGEGGEYGLEITGAVNDLAKGERIYAMRLMGERGFMVTFRQVDPLFTFDLRDPADPRQVGELKVPGFSTYLHPFDAAHLMGLGQSATEEGQITGMQLSMFDVADLANPTLAHKLLLGEGWSEALHDHHAFTWWAPEGLLMLPMESWDGELEAGLELYRVDLEAGFAAAGHVDHVGVAEWAPAIRRAVVIGDTLYTVSEVGVAMNSLDTLEREAAAAFPAQPDGGGGRDVPPDGGPQPEPAPGDPIPAG